MKTIASSLLTALLLVGVTALATPIDKMRVTTDLGEAVTVESVRYDGRAIVGNLVNRSGYTITDVKLLASDSFRWSNERHPGPDDPSRAISVTLAGPVAPNELFTVTATMPPRPERSDGYFVPRLEVVSLVRVEDAPQQ